jgi:hypothetical protein
MRIHGIHVQGLKAPAGRHRLRFDPGYNSVFAPDEQAAAGLAALFCAFLYPRTDLGNLEIWRDPGAGEPARAGFSLSFGPEVFRLIVDLEKQRLVLGRYDAASKGYERVSTDPDEIEACLRGAGLPGREEFVTLQLCRGSALAAEPEPVQPVDTGECPGEQDPGREQARLLQELERAQSARHTRDELEQRLAELRQARERLAPLERDYLGLLAELEQRAALGEGVDALDSRLERLKELEVEISRERSRIEQSRRELLDERTALRRIPPRQVLPLWIGVALSVLGTLAGLAGHTLFYLFGLLGAATAVGALFVSRNARRRMGTVEACLAALRVRQRAVERDFESESAPVRELMQGLGVSTLDELARQATEYRGLLARAKELEQDLTEVRKVFPEKADEELRHLEETLGTLADAPDPDEIRGALAALADSEPATLADAGQGPDGVCDSEPAPRVPPSADTSGPDEMTRAAALATGRTDAEIQERLGPTLPVYLPALSMGSFTKAHRSVLDGWLLSGESPGEVVCYEELPAPQQFAVHLAFRLAILEAIAPDLSVPLLVGPWLSLDVEEQKLALARALRRLGAAVQVIQIGVGEGAWCEHANRSLVLS